MSELGAPGALAGLRALDLTGHRAQLCGRLLAHMRADVITIEAPHGDDARATLPLPGPAVASARPPSSPITQLRLRPQKPACPPCSPAPPPPKAGGSIPACSGPPPPLSSMAPPDTSNVTKPSRAAAPCIG